MAIKTFAAIDVGSYELAMKIYEISAKNGIKEIDEITLKEVLKNDDTDAEEIELTNENS